VTEGWTFSPGILGVNDRNQEGPQKTLIKARSDNSRGIASQEEGEKLHEKWYNRTTIKGTKVGESQQSKYARGALEGDEGRRDLEYGKGVWGKVCNEQSRREGN